MKNQDHGASGGQGFHYQPTDRFTRRLEEIRSSDPPGYARIRLVIERLLLHPEDADGKLQGPHRGKLKKYAGKTDYRIVYNWCRECRKANEHLRQACPYCGEIPADSVVFFDLFHKSEFRKLGY